MKKLANMEDNHFLVEMSYYGAGLGMVLLFVSIVTS